MEDRRFDLLFPFQLSQVADVELKINDYSKSQSKEHISMTERL